MIVIAMGYSGTGSSAIIHLLSEYEECTDCGLGKYEHLPFYTPHGLFDLEDRLLSNNSLYSSDAAINDFYNAMKRLNDKDFGWFGGYSKRYGTKFMEIVNEFIEAIVQYKEKGFWSYDFTFKRNIYTVVRDCVKKAIGKKVVNFGYKLLPYGDHYLNYSFVSSADFYRAAKRFVYQYFDMICPDKEKILLLDQIILPQHLHRIHNYFDDDVKCIVFDRDVRDIYINTNYIIPKMYGVSSMFPLDPSKFVDFYKKYRAIEVPVTNKNVLRMNFEELIYEYDYAVKKIEDFLGIEPSKHIRKKKIFKPDVSIKNTQNFRICPEWFEKTLIMEKELPDLIYNFPFEITPTLEETSDP